jgi:ADP-ribosyltransferase exoenzyme
MKNLFKEYKLRFKQKNLPVSDISHHHKKTTKKIPIADISHHHSKKLNEDVASWVNKTQPEEHHLYGVNLSSTHGLMEKLGKQKDQLEHLSNEHISKLSTQHHRAVDAYITGGLESGHDTGSQHVNNHLIKAHTEGTEPTQHFKFGNDDDDDGNEKELHLQHLDDAINQNKLTKPLTTYSGIGFHPGHLMGDGNKIHLPAYTSSSTNRGVALLYSKKLDGAHHVLKITHPKGSTGLYIGDNEDVSPFNQKEHISPRNMTITVNKTPEVHQDSSGNTLHVWSATRDK